MELWNLCKVLKQEGVYMKCGGKVSAVCIKCKAPLSWRPNPGLFCEGCRKLKVEIVPSMGNENICMKCHKKESI